MDWSNAGGKTALHIAAQSGNVEFVKVSRPESVVAWLSFTHIPYRTDVMRVRSGSEPA